MGSLGIAPPPEAKDVTLSLFGGRKTDIAASDLPEGLTPDEQDSIYVPGEWISRPGLARLYGGAVLPAGVSVLYEKTYVQPNDEPLTLVLTSDGKLWSEDITNNPGHAQQIGSTTPGLYAQSATEFGREYIAFSDLLHGQGVPLQFDGSNLDRVTMDGPGAGPTVADFTTQVTISSIAPVNGSGITTAEQQGESWNISATSEVGNLATVLTSTNHGLAPGDTVIIAGAAVAAYDGVWTVETVPTATTFTYLLTATGLGAGGAAGTAQQAIFTVTVVTTAPHGLLPGQPVFIVGNGVPGYNGLWTVDTVISATSFTYTADTAALPNTTAGFAVPGLQVTTAAPHGLEIGDSFQINGSDNTDGAAPYDNGINQNPTYWQVAGDVVPMSFVFVPVGIGSQSLIHFTTTGGTLTCGGMSSPGVHQCVEMWLTRQGALSKPSPPTRFVSAGNTKWKITNPAIGPSNVVARVFAFTGAGGDNFFAIVSTATFPNPTGYFPDSITIGATSILDNVSTSAVFDVSDNALFDAIAIDQVGNDLFDQVVLGPVLGFYAYASRLLTFGDYNQVENFINMGFCGGYLSGVLTAPLGWNSGGNVGGTLVNGGSWTSGMSWQITGDGTNAEKGLLTQSAYQDANGDAIIAPNTNYFVRFWGKASAANLNGSVFIELTSVLASFAAVIQIPINTLTTAGGFIPLTSLGAGTPTPAVIPTDMLLSVFETNLNNGAIVTIGEIEFIFEDNPYRDSESRLSYTLNPEAFAATTGNLGPDDDDSQIRCFALLRQNSLLETAEGVHVFSDNGNEPDEWPVNSLTRASGVVSIRGGDPGKFGTGDAAEDWALVASKNGVYLHAGAEFWKVSQEISRGALPQSQDPRKCWDDINWAAQQTIVAKNDPSTRRAYFAVPINGATTPNVVFVLDYREMDTAAQIASAAPLHITIQGKMKSSDLTRKWSVWNIAANDIEILERPNNQHQIFFAGGAGGAVAANLYSLDPTKLTDDDFGQISPYYTTYFFTDHDQEQALGIGSDMKLLKHMHAFATGVGLLYITPIVNSLYNFYPNLSIRQLSKDTDGSNFLSSDLEWTNVGVRGQRIAFRISVQPLPGSTDVQLRLQKLIPALMKDPVAQFRQSGV